ncbi:MULTISPECIES: hypothetical protein [unclassified Tenacibaculum]|uniref:hypothetical protein n=1 Tax=unclassified Tenacibaculum TaxID=2635139 RepID=UPI001F306C0D|nr:MULTISPECIES: hypothetical protein [unclassified Tenacibaculum]MCF2875518.1 hypothetical protein [Tenacibaculum sp. Cn5-1]MCF2935594.1 hypothetical protein [Tenacibaculum sp. Cn5-34]MCG7512154.1 hypothetical protein [Tenacibaculum sp. Cn5-46]
MKKTILNLGKSLNKIEQKRINGGGFVDCNQFPRSLCFGPVPGCLPCDQLINYPGAMGCVRVHIGCISDDILL